MAANKNHFTFMVSHEMFTVYKDEIVAKCQEIGLHPQHALSGFTWMLAAFATQLNFPLIEIAELFVLLDEKIKESDDSV